MLLASSVAPGRAASGDDAAVSDPFAALAARPRVSLAALPTPLEPARRLSEELGVEVWLKRDDVGSLGLAGNKVRKLEFAFGEALDEGARAVVALGAPQSNHARTTAAAAARLGLPALLVMRGDDPGGPATGNLLLDALFGVRRSATAAPTTGRSWRPPARPSQASVTGTSCRRAARHQSALLVLWPPTPSCSTSSTRRASRRGASTTPPPRAERTRASRSATRLRSADRSRSASTLAGSSRIPRRWQRGWPRGQRAARRRAGAGRE